MAIPFIYNNNVNTDQWSKRNAGDNVLKRHRVEFIYFVCDNLKKMCPFRCCVIWFRCYGCKWLFSEWADYCVCRNCFVYGTSENTTRPAYLIDGVNACMHAVVCSVYPQINAFSRCFSNIFGICAKSDMIKHNDAVFMMRDKRVLRIYRPNIQSPGTHSCFYIILHLLRRTKRRTENMRSFEVKLYYAMLWNVERE